jgi:hypothetical protein
VGKHGVTKEINTSGNFSETNAYLASWSLIWYGETWSHKKEASLLLINFVMAVKFAMDLLILPVRGLIGLQYMCTAIHTLGLKITNSW